MERRGTQTLGGIVAAVRERWLVVLVSTLVGTMLAFWIGGSLAASYASTAVVQVYSQGRPADMSTERLIAASDSVAADAASGLTWGITAAELQDATTVGNPQGSFLLTFEVRLPDPQEAARSANAFANAYLDSRRALLQETEGTEDVIAGFLVDPAEAPSEPSGVSAGLYAIGGLALGLLLGIVLALFVDRADPRVRSARRMQQLFYDDIFVTTDDPADASAMLAVLAHRAAQGDPSPSLALVGPDAELIGRLMPYFQRPILVPGVTPGANGEVGIRSVNAAAQPWESLQIATAAESDVSVIVATASDSRKRIISLHDHLVQVTGKPTVGWFIQTKRVRKRRRAVELRSSSQQQKADREPRAPRTRTKQGGGAMTTVSVVVPTHNRPELMTRAVASAAAQDWDGEIEIIVVFDASEVFTPDVALAAGRSIRVQENVRSRGLAGARNTGIASATGEWVAFLDDDDIWHRGKLSRQFAALAEHPEAQMCVSGMTIDNGRALVERPLDAATIHLDELIRDRLAAVHSSSFLIRREALLTDVGLIDEELPASYAEDYDILLRAARRAPIVAVPEPLITVTWKGQSLFAKNWPAISDALQHMLDKHPEFDEDPIGRARIEAQIAIAESGRGDKRSGRAWLARAARSNPREKRLPVGALVSYGVLTPERANRMAAYVGRGI